MRGDYRVEVVQNMKEHELYQSSMIKNQKPGYLRKMESKKGIKIAQLEEMNAQAGF